MYYNEKQNVYSMLKGCQVVYCSETERTEAKNQHSNSLDEMVVVTVHRVSTGGRKIVYSGGKKRLLSHNVKLQCESCEQTTKQ